MRGQFPTVEGIPPLSTLAPSNTHAAVGRPELSSVSPWSLWYRINKGRNARREIRSRIFSWGFHQNRFRDRPWRHFPETGLLFHEILGYRPVWNHATDFGENDDVKGPPRQTDPNYRFGQACVDGRCAFSWAGWFGTGYTGAEPTHSPFGRPCR